MNKETPLRDSFVFYRSFYEAIKELPQENQLEIYNAIAEYSLNFVMPELKGISKTIFILIKPQIEANQKRYINGTKPKRKQTGSKTEAKPKQNKSKTETNVNVNVNANENVNANDEIIDSSDSKIKNISGKLEFFETELKQFFDIQPQSNTFNRIYLDTVNIKDFDFDYFKQQFYDYREFQKISGQYKKNIKTFLEEWDGTNWKKKTEEVTPPEKNHYPDMSSQQSKVVNGKTIYRVIPNEEGKPSINPKF